MLFSKKNGASGTHGISAKLLKSTIIVIAALLLTACSKSDSKKAAATDTQPLIILTNAIADSPALKVSLDVDPTESDNTPVTSVSVAFRSATGVVKMPPGVLGFKVEYTDPATNQLVTLLPQQEITTVASTIYTIVLKGSIANASHLVLEKPFGDIADSTTEAEVQVVNVSSLDPADVFIYKTTATKGAATATLSPNQSSTPAKLAVADKYVIAVAKGGVSEELYHASNIPLIAKGRRLIVVTDDLSTSPISASVYVLNESASVSNFKNEALAARVRILNFVSDQDKLLFKVSDSFQNNEFFNTTLDFRAASIFQSVKPSSDFANIVVSHPDQASTELHKAVLSPTSDQLYSFVMAGEKDASTLASKFLLHESQPQATQARIHFVNAAKVKVSAGDSSFLTLNFYALKAGESIATTQPKASNLAFLADKSHLQGATPIVIVATDPKTNNIVAGPLPYQLESASRIVIAATEPANGGLPLLLTVIKDIQP